MVFSWFNCTGILSYYVVVTVKKKQQICGHLHQFSECHWTFVVHLVINICNFSSKPNVILFLQHHLCNFNVWTRLAFPPPLYNYKGHRGSCVRWQGSFAKCVGMKNKHDKSFCTYINAHLIEEFFSVDLVRPVSQSE